MTTAGTTIESPRIGQTISFLRTAADTGGSELVIEAVMRPGAFLPPHVHTRQDEHFEVLRGTATFTVDRKKIIAEPGEQLNVPAGVAHRFRNATTADVRIRGTLRPALRTEELFERLFRLGAAGRVNRLGAPNPLVTAALIREFREEFFYLAGIPIPLQRLLAGARP
jgi:mannose-6-phosphate isomerase-like protein (cupin superfamily)